MKMRLRGASTSISQTGEAELLRRIRRRFGGRWPGVVVGVGDDAAILEGLGTRAAISTDTLIEDVDFRLRWASWADVGHKVAAANLSDLAAMGAEPTCYRLQFVSPRKYW